MDILNVTKEDVKNVERLALHEGFTGEGIVIKNVCDDKDAFKIFYISNGLYFSNKLYTINALYDLHGKLGDRFVLPSRLLSVDEKIVGFSMPLIKGVTLQEVLNDSDIDINTKVKYLKEIGDILDEMKRLREENESMNFFLNDLHDKNIMVDLDNGKLHVVDLDSCRINGNHPFLSKFLSSFGIIKNYPFKYHKADISCGGEFVADENSDLYCYAMIVLDFLAKIRVNSLDEKDYFGYLEYLKSIGAPTDLVDAWARVYSTDDNINFKEFLDSLPYFYANASVEKCLKRIKG